MGLILIGYVVMALVVAVGMIGTYGVPRGNEWWVCLVFAGFWPIGVPMIIKWEMLDRPYPPPSDVDQVDWVSSVGAVVVLAACLIGGAHWLLRGMHELTVQNRPKPAVEAAE